MYSAGEPLNEIEWITDRDSRWSLHCEWSQREICTNRPAAKIMHGGTIQLYVCEDHATEHHRNTGARFLNER